MIALLVACTEPPLLAAIGAELGAQAATTAGVPVQMFVATVSVVGETCGVLDVEGHAFDGGGARRLGVTTVEVSTDGQGNHVWTFADAGLGADRAPLVVAADAQRTRFNTEWSAATSTMSAELKFADCPVDISETDASEDSGDGGDSAPAEADFVLVSGNGNWSQGEAASEIVLQGDGSEIGLRFAPPSASAPSVGWLRWNDGRSKDVITLNGAETITASGWPGVAVGVGWTAAVTVSAP